MYHAVVHYPEIERKTINAFRRKYDPHFDLINAHITLVFPVPESVGEKLLTGHIETVLSSWHPFDIHLKGFEKAWDHWLLLIVQEGNDDLIKLHDELYTGILAPYLRHDIGFVPHIALGLFTAKNSNYDLRDPKEVPFDHNAYVQALKEAEALRMDYWTTVPQLHLVKLDDKFTKIVWEEEFTFITH